MFLKITTLFFLLTTLHYAKPLDFEYVGVEVNVTAEGKKQKSILVKRHIPKACKKVPITYKTLWSESYAHHSVPDECKSTFIHTKGKLLAISLDPEVETYGELEI